MSVKQKKVAKKPFKLLNVEHCAVELLHLLTTKELKTWVKLQTQDKRCKQIAKLQATVSTKVWPKLEPKHNKLFIVAVTTRLYELAKQPAVLKLAENPFTRSQLVLLDHILGRASAGRPLRLGSAGRQAAASLGLVIESLLG